MTTAEQLAIKAAQSNARAQEDILNHYRRTNSRNWEEMQQERIKQLVERNKRQW